MSGPASLSVIVLSCNFSQPNGGWDAPEFFGVVIQRTFRQLRNGRFSSNLVTKRSSVSSRGKTFSKIFTLGVICPQNLKSKIGETGTSLRASYRSWVHRIKILFTPSCSPRARDFPRSVNFSLWCTVAELRGVKVAQFSDFGLFFPYKTPKKYLRWPAYSQGVTSQNDYEFFLVVVDGPKRCLPKAKFSCDFWYGSWGPPNLPKFSPMANGDTHKECYNTTKMSENAQFWFLTTGVLFHQISSHLPPKSPQNPILGEFSNFQCKTSYRETYS